MVKKIIGIVYVVYIAWNRFLRRYDCLSWSRV